METTPMAMVCTLKPHIRDWRRDENYEEKLSEELNLLFDECELFDESKFGNCDGIRNNLSGHRLSLAL